VRDLAPVAERVERERAVTKKRNLSSTILLAFAVAAVAFGFALESIAKKRRCMSDPENEDDSDCRHRACKPSIYLVK